MLTKFGDPSFRQPEAGRARKNQVGHARPLHAPSIARPDLSRCRVTSIFSAKRNVILRGQRQTLRFPAPDRRNQHLHKTLIPDILNIQMTSQMAIIATTR